ncbi:MAG: CBS domain-containing protein [Desulfobacterales bacterium]|nr:CBS domain-containing protein [Desulfobacterales bacterium]
MKIEDLMIREPITITATTTVEEALACMKTNSVRHLPVVGADQKLLGFVTLADLKQGLIPSMVSDLTLTDLMIKKPITVAPERDIEIAAQLIYKHKIGGLPVVEEGRLVGIITVTDLLGAFINMMGLLSASSRVDVVIDHEPGSLKNAIHLINEAGGDIINIAMAGQQSGHRTYYFRLTACDTSAIRAALENDGYHVLDAMD